MTSRGTLYLVPNGLDVGTSDAEADLGERLPLGTLRVAARLGHWVCENAKTTRAFLKRVDAVCRLERPLQKIAIVELPRPPKGRPDTATFEGDRRLAPAVAGEDVGLISEAGLPAVADPGAQLVAAAHAAAIRVVALAGASSITLAVAASGLNGQSFAFVGYLPVDAGERSQRLRELEAHSRRWQQTPLVIETPYRNPALLQALLAGLSPATRLSVSCALTLPEGFTRTDTVANWRRQPPALPDRLPAVFAFLAT